MDVSHKDINPQTDVSYRLLKQLWCSGEYLQQDWFKIITMSVKCYHV